MNPEAEQSRPGCRPWGRRFAAFVLIAIRHSSSWLLRIFFSLLILGALLFTYLHMVGLPAYLADAFLDRMARQGYHLQIERLTLEIDRGLVARNIRMFATPDAPEPFLTAEALTVALHPVALLRQRRLVPVLAIQDGVVRAHLGPERSGAREGLRSIVVSGIHLRFSASPQEILLREFSADLLGIHFRGRGAAYPAPPAEGIEPAPPPGNPLAAALHALEHAPDPVLQWVEQINSATFHTPPTADFTFAVYPAHPQSNTVDLRLRNPAGMRIHGIDFDYFNLDLTWKNQRLHLPDLQLHKGDGRLGLSGWYAATNQWISLHLVNTIPPAPFLEWLPSDARRQALDLVSDFDIPVRLDLQVGPAPLARALEQAAGRLIFSGTTIRDVPIRLFDARLVRDGSRIQIEKAHLHLDSEPAASRLDISAGFFQLDTLRFEARVAGGLEPHILKPWMTPNMRNIVEWFGFQEPLQGDVIVGGTVGDPAIYCYGTVLATHCTIQGVPIQSAHIPLNITNEVMHITGGRLVRPEGVARGDGHMAFSNETLRISVESTLDPRATAQMMGPVVAEFMEPFRLNGPARIQAEGLVDFNNFSLNRIQARVEAQGFGYDLWEADTAAFDLVVRGRRIRFTNAVATAYGGRFSGHGIFYPVGNDLDWRYEADLEAAGARLDDVLAASFGEPIGDVRGMLDGTAKVGGYIGPGTGPLATGTGRATIRNGLLFQSKLLSGLSAILAKVIPDFNLFAQTDASGTYAIRNSRVHSRDIELQGTLFSVKATGTCSFAGDLDYRVEVQPLRGGPVAALVRLATRPVTRLLEFRLTGTFEDPRWRPVNFNLADLFD